MSFSSFLRGKVAMITGGGGTIGQAIASKLVNHGASVILVGRSLDRLKDAKFKVLQHAVHFGSKPTNVSILSCDVTNEASVGAMFEGVGKSVDVLIQLRPPSQPLTLGGKNRFWPIRSIASSRIVGSSDSS